MGMEVRVMGLFRSSLSCAAVAASFAVSTGSCQPQVLSEPGTVLTGAISLDSSLDASHFAELNVILLTVVAPQPGQATDYLYSESWSVTAGMAWPVPFTYVESENTCHGLLSPVALVAWLSTSAGSAAPAAGDPFGYRRVFTECEKDANVVVNGEFRDWPTQASQMGVPW